MMKHLFITIIIAIVSWGANAQADSLLYQSRLQIGVGLGFSISNSNLSIGKPTDDLIHYRKTTFGIMTPLLSYFPTKHWGITGSVGFNLSGNHPEYDHGIFISNGDNYYRDNTNAIDMPGGDVQVVGQLGVVYRYEWSRWQLNVAATAGVTSFSKYWGGYYLKEKNSNNVYRLIYRADNTSEDYFTMGLSAKMSYVIGKRLCAFAALQYTYMNPHFNYTELVENLATNNVTTTQVYHYDKHIVTMNVCVGVSFMIHKRKPKQPGISNK